MDLPGRILAFVTLAAPCLMATSSPAGPSSGQKGPLPLVVTTFVETQEEILWARVMVESLRTFGARLKDAPVWVYVSEAFRAAENAAVLARLDPDTIFL